MSFEGKSKVGYFKKEDLYFKIMHCDQLETSLLLEIEKEAKDHSQIKLKSQELIEYVQKMNLMNKVIREEPPTMLYHQMRKRKNSLNGGIK